MRMAATRRLQKELLDIRREEKETVSIILKSSVRNSLFCLRRSFIYCVANLMADLDPDLACYFDLDSACHLDPDSACH